MVKFSLIVTIYNVESYLSDCLDSIINQTYTNYEVIMVDDGSIDKSKSIMDKYAQKDKRFKSYTKDNGGVSTTRNYGINLASGDYFIFIDSDDTINEQLLENLNKEIEKNPNIDLIKYGIEVINKHTTTYKRNNLFSNISGGEAFKLLIQNELFVTPVTYAYRLKYFKDNNFTYAEGHIHEDFGLTPLVVIKANSVSSIDYIGYNYIIRENSIMTNNSKNKLIKKNEDMLYHFDYLIKEIEKVNVNDDIKKIFKSYIANAMISRTILLEKELLTDYINELNKRDIAKYLLTDNLKRKIKKLLYKLNPYIYIKLFVK